MIDFCKLEIFIPQSHLGILQETLYSLDAGHIGNYDCCLSYSQVISTWRPLDGSNPFIGETGKVSQQTELKVEVTCRFSQVEAIIQAIKLIHPYEEPVINAIPLLHTAL